jgi:hypothetical protein
MGALAQSITTDLVAELETELDAIGAEMVADIRDSISVYVVYSGNAVITRSQPGESPRYETGNLWRHVLMEVNADRGAGIVRLDVFVDGDAAPYGLFLETGTENMESRPFWEPAWLRWADRVPPLLIAAPR